MATESELVDVQHSGSVCCGRLTKANNEIPRARSQDVFDTGSRVRQVVVELEAALLLWYVVFVFVSPL